MYMESERENIGKWREVVASKYLGNDQSSLHQSWWWRDVCNISEEDKKGSWFNKHVLWKVGDEKVIRLWEDLWLGDAPLKLKYHRLYLLSEDKEKRIQQLGVWEHSMWKWNMQWRRMLFEWEKKQLLKLETDLIVGVVQQGGQDKVVWVDEEGGGF